MIQTVTVETIYNTFRVEPGTCTWFEAYATYAIMKTYA